jgi:alanine racemase
VNVFESENPSLGPDAMAASILEIDLDAITGNWRALCARLKGRSTCTAVVKADAYGLGALPVAKALEKIGCRFFFVAHLPEALALRSVLLPQTGIGVMHGPLHGTEPMFIASGLTPVLNSLEQLDAWQACAHDNPASPAVWLQVDTGMARMGFSPQEWAVFLESQSRRARLRLQGIMSHLACADERTHPMNPTQLDRFRAIMADFPGVAASLANSSGIFLGKDYHFDLVRPGAALYGINPTPDESNPMRGVVELKARVIQLRDIPAGTGVGYGHAWCAPRPTRLATLSTGYADGFFRRLGGQAHAFVEGQAVPIVGRVSMDSLVIDISSLSAQGLRAGDLVSLMGPQATVDTLAKQSGTIGYEVLTRLGTRHARRYRTQAPSSFQEGAGQALV